MTLEVAIRRHQLRLAGLIGVVGMTLGVLADLASGYSTDGASGVTTAFSVLSIDTLAVFLASKPPAAVVFGHYLAVIGIPLGLFGLWQVYRAIQPAGWALSHSAWYVGAFAYVVGTVFHSAYAFITFGVQAAGDAPPSARPAIETMLERFALVFEPLAVLLVGLMAVAFGLLFYAIAFRETHYPRWFALANPLVVQAATAALAFVAPLELRVFLVVTAYNLSVVVFYAISTVLLWNRRPAPASVTRSGPA